MYIYILLLSNNKYYVGRTNNPNFRLADHFNRNGANWTKKYTPRRVIDIIPNCDTFDEDKYTILYMQKYGIDNVRGGSFCEERLSNANVGTINKMIQGATNKCYICGNKGHYANECTNGCNKYVNTIGIEKNKEEDEYIIIKKDTREKLINTLMKENRCYRCHRKGHYIRECYAKTYENGEIINSNNAEYVDVPKYITSENKHGNKDINKDGDENKNDDNNQSATFSIQSITDTIIKNTIGECILS